MKFFEQNLEILKILHYYKIFSQSLEPTFTMPQLASKKIGY
jgi:hypothetical protein